MNKELAQELKDAGFPQGNTGERLNKLIAQGGVVNFNSDDPIIPTAQEIEDAIGVLFLKAVHPGITYKGITDSTSWWAYGKYKEDVLGEQGNTEVEALANLYLSLKRNGAI